MTDSSYVHYLIIIDRSGSMENIKDDMNGGLHTFIDKQLEGVDSSKRTVSLYQFDTSHDCVHDFDLLEDAKSYELVPRGGTALLDACGRAINDVGAKLKKLPESKRPGNVMVIIVTDGQENSSREFTRAHVKEMIQHQQDKYNWKFTYLGANQDAFAEAGSIGIPMASSLNYYSTGASVGATYDVLSASVSRGTVSTSASIRYTEDQRKKAFGGTQ